MSEFRYEPEFPINGLNPADKRFMSRTDLAKMEANTKLLMKDISLRGQIDPVGIARLIDEDEYILIYGFTRTAAIQQLGQSTIKANVYDDISDQEARILNAANNSMREDLNPWERALQMKKLQSVGVPVDSDEEDKDTICKLMKVDRRTVFNWIKVLEYGCNELHDAIAQGKIGLRHALEMVNYPPEVVRDIIPDCIEESWSSGILALKLKSATLHDKDSLTSKDDIQSATLHDKDSLTSKDDIQSETLHNEDDEGINVLRRAAGLMNRVQSEDLKAVEESALMELGRALRTVMRVIAPILR